MNRSEIIISAMELGAPRTIIKRGEFPDFLDISFETLCNGLVDRFEDKFPLSALTVSIGNGQHWADFKGEWFEGLSVFNTHTDHYLTVQCAVETLNILITCGHVGPTVIPSWRFDLVEPDSIDRIFEKFDGLCKKLHKADYTKS